MPLIVLEGIDKAGKGTQARILADSLRKLGRTVGCVSFPDYGTPLGREIERFLMGEVFFRPEVRQLLYVANRWELEADMRKWLDEGDYVVADRYIPAGLVYGLANGLDLNWMLALEEGLPEADLIIVLDLDPEVAVQRERGKDVYEKDMVFQRRTRKLYLDLAVRFDWKVVNGERDMVEVAEDVFGLVKEKLKLGRAS